MFLGKMKDLENYLQGIVTGLLPGEPLYIIATTKRLSSLMVSSKILVCLFKGSRKLLSTCYLQKQLLTAAFEFSENSCENTRMEFTFSKAEAVHPTKCQIHYRCLLGNFRKSAALITNSIKGGFKEFLEIFRAYIFQNSCV